MVILKGETKSPLTNYLTEAATGFISPGVVLAVGLGLLVVLIIRRPSYIGSWFQQPSLLTGFVFTVLLATLLMLYRGIPVPALVVSIPAIATAFLLERTIFGRHLYAFGAAPQTAHLSGVRTRRVLLLVYLNNGLMAALAGLIVAGRLNAVTPKAGNLFELDAITVCLVGGASMVGGVGRIGHVLLGAILIGVLNNGLSITGIGNEALIKAMIMLTAGYADTVLTRNGTDLHPEAQSN